MLIGESLGNRLRILRPAAWNPDVDTSDIAAQGVNFISETDLPVRGAFGNALSTTIGAGPPASHSVTSVSNLVTTLLGSGLLSAVQS